MYRFIRPWIATLLFTAALAPASEAGQVQLVARAAGDLTPHSITPDARFVTVRTATGHLFLVDRSGAPSVLIDHASGSSAPANSIARYPILSADGAFVVFRSTANDLVPGQTDGVGTDNVFLYERATGQNTLISQGQTPGGPSNGFSGAPAISADGRYVVFGSEAEDLVPGQVDSPGTNDLFLYDRVAGTLTLVSHAAGSTATAANGKSYSAVLSDDAAFVAFTSEATNLVSGQSDSNGDSDVFLYDRASGTTTLVSHAAGLPTTTGWSFSYGAQISADGRYVAFTSKAGNLVTGQIDSVSTLDVFLFDRVAGTMRIVSHQSGAPTTAGNGLSARPAMSDDGRFIAFDSDADNLAVGTTDTPFASVDTFVWDRDSETTTLVSHAPGAPTEAASSSYSPKISGDGSFVGFISYFQHLPGQTNNMGRPDLFLFDRASAAIVLVTRSYLSATQEADEGFYPSDDEWFIDADGSQVVFASGATDFEPGGDSAVEDVWAFDNGLQGHFYTVAPCRLLDTRTPADGPALSSEVTRLFSLHARCGIPATAKALAINVTVIGAPQGGHLTLFPGDASAPLTTSTVNFRPGQTRANNTLAALASNANGTLALRPFLAGGGAVHVTLDVSGYFE